MRVSIEVGHTRLLPGGLFNPLAVQRSVTLGAELGSTLCEHGIDVHYTVLADDKELAARNRGRDVNSLIGVVGEQLPVDYYFPEHQLQVYLADVIALLPKEGLRRRVTRDLTQQLGETGALPCSADIAIWHALRLGLMADKKRIAVDHDGIFSPSDFIVSILPDGDQEAEQVARDRYLKHMPDNAQNRVQRIFYPVAADQRINDDALQDTINTILTTTTEANIS